MIKTVFFFVLLSVTICMSTLAPYSEAEYQHIFTKWMTQYEKNYEIEEFFHRYSIFKDNLNFISEHNAQNHSYTVGLNQFADLNSKEFKARNKLVKRPTSNENLNSKSKSVKADPPGTRRNPNPPPSIDWRQHGAVVAVKDQKSCGCCYAFGSISTVETEWAIKKGVLNSLSEQELVDCSASAGNHGCGGGQYEYSYQYIINKKGISSEASYPYTATDGSCNTVTQRPVTISSYYPMAIFQEAGILEAVSLGSVGVEVEATQQFFQFYSGGVFDNAECGTNTDHSVVIVGYGVSLGQPYWAIRNSWGATWGEHGYMRIARGKNRCNIAEGPYYPIVL